MGRPQSGGASPRLSLRVSRSLKKALALLAKAEKRNPGDYTRTVLEEHVDHMKEIMEGAAFGTQPKTKLRRTLETALSALDGPRNAELLRELKQIEETQRAGDAITSSASETLKEIERKKNQAASRGVSK